MKISVVITAYNHEKYIAQCLESVLNQKGDFQVEVIVGDDFSTDNTREIVEEFQKRYPKIISVLSGEKNLGVIKNLKRCLNACSGKYIAICEGDDYWIDENKLQKQKDFLGVRKDCSMCFSAILLYYEEDNLFVPHDAQASLKTDAITIEDLIQNNYIGNFSCCMYRADTVKKLPQRIYDLNTVDWMFNMACAQLGKIGFIQNQMSVYRLHSGGAWTSKTKIEKREEICNYIDISNKFFDYKYDTLFSTRKKIIQDEIVHLKQLEDSSKNDGNAFKSFITRLSFRLMNMMKTGMRLFRNGSSK